MNRWLGAAIALAAAVPLLAAPALRAAQPDAAPAFELRGVVQGSYGPVWSHADRLDAVRWLGAHDMNTYVHAPKDDAFQRYAWREPYPPEQLAEFAIEIAAGRDVGVAWVPNLSPGVPVAPTPIGAREKVSRDICFSCPADLDVLVAKLRPFIDAGTRTVMVSFDDVRMVSTHPEDARAYGSGEAAYARMNHDLLNALQERLVAIDPGLRLLTVLPYYSGTADTEYLAAFRARGPLREGITVMWTGAYVLSHDIPTDHATAYARLVGVDRVAIWDNYPANDLAGNAVGATRRLFLGPYRGRAPDLNRAVSGVLVNVMNEAWANRIALGTVSDYLRDPARYDPEAAWRRSIADLAGGDPARTDALTVLAENSRSSMLDTTESPVFMARSEAFLAAIDGDPFWTDAYALLVAEAQREARAVHVLRQSYPSLQEEAGRFLDRLQQNAAVIEAAAEVLARQQPGLDVRRQDAAVIGCARPPIVANAAGAARRMHGAQAVTASSTADVHGDRATPTFGGANVGRNHVDAFHQKVSVRHVRWLPTAAAAATSISVTVDGRDVGLDGRGCFSVDIGAAPSGHRVSVVATDASGRATGRRV